MFPFLCPTFATYPTPSRFPGERETSKAQPLPNVQSTWTLVDVEEDVNENADPRRSTPARKEPLFLVPITGPKGRPNTPSEGPQSGTHLPSQMEQGLPVRNNQRAPDPCVDAPGRWFFLFSMPREVLTNLKVSPVTTTSRMRTRRKLENSRTESPSLFRQLKKGNPYAHCPLVHCSLFTSTACQASFATVRSAVQGIRRRNARTPTQQSNHTGDAEVGRRKPMLRALQSSCCCRCTCC